jgi:hypothetical protein
MREYREGLPEVPPHMRQLPIDPRGFPVPWFTPWDEQKQCWRFDAADFRRWDIAVNKRRCWICGGQLFRNLAFLVGPMCVINRTTSEPASHCECAEFAAKACPFLSRPRMRRASNEDVLDPPGILFERNPGVCVVWVARTFRPWSPPGGGKLIEIGDPIRADCYAEGRRATPDEVIQSIVTGLPKLFELCSSRDDLEEMERRIKRAWAELKLPGDPPNQQPEELRQWSM